MNRTDQRIVALVGHCGPDASFLRMAVSGSAPGTRIVSLGTQDEVDAAVEAGDIELFLLNRRLDYGFDDEDGIGLIRRIKARRPDQKVMLVSNYADAQAAAEAAGALPGFGKREIGSAKAKQRVAEALETIEVR